MHRSAVFLNSSRLASLRFFVTAARTLSFKRAAAELHVTQGAVSQQIKHLEGALGVKLFIRRPGQVALTEEGVRFAGIVERALDDIEDAAQAFTAVRTTVDLRLRAAPSFSLRWLVPRLADFYTRHAHIRLFVEGAYGIYNPGRREFDLAIERLREPVSGICSELLMKEQLVPVCSPPYLKRHAFLKKPGDLVECTLLHDAQPWVGASESAEWQYWLNQVGADSVDSTAGQFFNLANMAIEAALTDQGVAMGRLALIKRLLDAGQLVAPFKPVIESPTHYYLVYHKDLTSRPSMRAVVQWLHEQAAKSG